MGSIGTKCDNCRTPPPTEFTEGGATYVDRGSSQACDAFTPGNTVTVFYNPTDPSSAVIPVAGSENDRNYLFMEFGIAVFAASLIGRLYQFIKR